MSRTGGYNQLMLNCGTVRLCFTMHVVLYLCIASVVILGQVHGSAIPMWEYLSRGEKMSHLFNMFVQQVEKHCSQVSEPDCSKLLLVYGLKNLANMGDESLDDMDPYQRGANEIVWDSMMKGSDMHSTTPKSNSGEVNDMNSAEFENGEQSAGSSIHEETQPQSFLLGPMVVRVLPNGMPIPGEKNHLPKDEDVEEFVPSNYKGQNPAKLLISTTPSTTTTTDFQKPVSTTSIPTSSRYFNGQVKADPRSGFYNSQPNYYDNRRLYNSQQNPGNYYRNQQPFGRNYNEPFTSTFQVRSPMYTIH